jgi:predicted permease
MKWLDIKLGGRMLVRYPGLTVVCGLAMAFGIWVGIVIFQVGGLFLYPSLPLVNGDRIVQLSLQDVRANEPEGKALYDFTSWRDSLRSIESLGAWRDSTRNLIVARGDARPAFVAEMSSSGFVIADGQPLMGRVLTSADEQPAAPSVAVIGHDLWRTRFGSDPNVVGRTVQLGNEYPTIVGVMREGFAFPVSHELWLPLKTAVLDQAPRSGPVITIFGMLAPGQSIETAQAELTTHGRRTAADQPATHRYLEPRVSAYADTMEGSDLTFMLLIYFFVALLVVLICGNIGLLLFARAASRDSDLIVRTALGASRWRIVSQMFAEALVLGGLAAVVGLAAADLALRNWGMTFLEVNVGRLPFWFDLGVSPATVFVAILLTVLAAAVAGVMPALKITRGMSDRLKQTTAGSGGLRFGGVWSVVIVAQVAVTVVFPAIVGWEQFVLARMQSIDAGFATERFLAVQVERDDPEDTAANVDAATAERNARMAATLDELRGRVAEQPGVAGVTFIDGLPGSGHAERIIELGFDAADTAARGPEGPLPFRQATVAGVDPSYFDVVGAPILAGRNFTAADAAPGPRVAIVDQRFVDQVLQGRNPVGQQLRFADPGNPNGQLSTGTAVAVPPSEWYEVVGLVGNLDLSAPHRSALAAGFYLPGTPERFDEVHMMIRVRDGDPTTVAPQVQQLVAAVDPSLRLTAIQRMSESNNDALWVIRLWMRLTIVTSSMALLLSLAGLYAVMAFTVAKRTREIGVRVALGGSRERILMAVFRRPLTQMALGILAGITIVCAAVILYPSTDAPGADQATGLTLDGMPMLVGYAVLMLAVCLLACVVPTRRALAVEPTVALRTE